MMRGILRANRANSESFDFRRSEHAARRGVTLIADRNGNATPQALHRWLRVFVAYPDVRRADPRGSACPGPPNKKAALQRALCVGDHLPALARRAP
jgi:hypothetical protein